MQTPGTELVVGWEGQPSEEDGVVGVRLQPYNKRLRQARQLKGYKSAKAFAPAVGIPVNRFVKIEQLRTEPDEYSLQEIARFLGVDPTWLFPEWLTILVRDKAFSTRDVTLSEEKLIKEAEARYALLPPPVAPNPIDVALGSHVKEAVESVLYTLRLRERQVIELRFGLIDGRSRTLEEVAYVFRVTRERVRQIETMALRKLRHPTRSKHLKDFLDVYDEVPDQKTYFGPEKERPPIDVWRPASIVLLFKEDPLAFGCIFELDSPYQRLMATVAGTTDIIDETDEMKKIGDIILKRLPEASMDRRTVDGSMTTLVKRRLKFPLTKQPCPYAGTKEVKTALLLRQPFHQRLVIPFLRPGAFGPWMTEAEEPWI